MRIGIDLDGVLYDFNEALVQHLIENEGYSRSELPPSTRWAFYLDWDMTSAEFVDHCHNGVNRGIVFSYGAPHPGSKELLEALRADGHTLHIATDRSFGNPGMSEWATRDWLHRHGLPYDTLTFTADKTIVAVDMMIDDKPENYDALDAAGVEVWLLDRPWNRDHEVERRVYSLGEFYVKVENRLAFAPVSTPLPSGEVRTVASSGGEKGVKPARFDLIPARPLWTLAELYGYGAAKYADRNWERGYEWSKSFGAMMRHAWEFWMGVDIDDPEAGGSGLPHLASVAFHAFALMEWMQTHPEFDDRPATEAARPLPAPEDLDWQPTLYTSAIAEAVDKLCQVSGTPRHVLNLPSFD